MGDKCGLEEPHGKHGSKKRLDPGHSSIDDLGKIPVNLVSRKDLEKFDQVYVDADTKSFPDDHDQTPHEGI